MRWFIVSALLLFLTACEVNRSETADIAGGQQVTVETPFPDLGNAPDAAIDSQGEIPTNDATIDTVEILLLESFPVQANTVIRGHLPDTCSIIDEINQTRNDDIFEITVTTAHQTGVMCNEQSQLFEEIVPLDILGLPAGTFTVTVSGVNTASNIFALSVDNIPPQPPPTPDAEGGSISGIIWNDTCSDDRSVNCIADGLLNPTEQRLEGVEVTLYQGECPGGESLVDSTITDESGTYVFTGLRATAYCIVVDITSENNAPIFQTGTWSYPGVAVGNMTVRLGQNDYQAIDFGWDYQFSGQSSTDQLLTPSPGSQEADCTNAAAYVADVTIPDDTELAPGEAFVKTWRVSNEGTCSWGTGYSLVFEDGDLMGATPAIPFVQTVAPGTEVDLSVPLVAPDSAGVYRGNWKLQSPTGTLFGSRGDYPFYVQIVVSP